MLASDPNIDPEAFTTACLFAARDVGTNAHYLIAVAFVESGLTNIPAQGSSGFGPFQILEPTWAGFTARLGLTADDRFDPLLQPLVAAQIAADGTAALAKILPDGRLPTAGELYFAHLFGERGATVILSGDRDRSIRDALLEVFSGSDSGDRADAIIGANKGVMTDAAGHPQTVNALLQIVGQRLAIRLAQAVRLINKVEPDLFSGPGTDADDSLVPWMTVAKAEQARGVNDESPRVADFFKATTLGTGDGHVAWCGAFIAFCLSESGALREKGSARAADWLQFGQSLAGPEYGAIAVLERLVPDSSGHVGFVVGRNGDTVQLLAGNQSPPGGGADAVCIKGFNIGKVRSWRKPAV